MIRYLLDTDTFSLLERGGQVTLEERLVTVPASEVAITVVTVEEQMTGRLARLRSAKTVEEAVNAYHWLTVTANALKRINVAPFEGPAHTRFAALRAQKRNIGPMDLRIAAIALELGATVVTRNLRDFSRVPGLSVEDWT